MAHKLLYSRQQSGLLQRFGYDVIEQYLTHYLNTKKELAEHKVTCYQDRMRFTIILDISFRYDEIGLVDWRTMRLTFDSETFTDKEPSGHADRILFGCVAYNG